MTTMSAHQATSIANALFSSVQQRILALLFGNPDRSFYTNEIIRLGNTGRGALQRELARLTSSGLVNAAVVGHQKHYQANRDSPIFAELRSIAMKTFGLADVLRNALAAYREAIRYAFVFGSVAKGGDTAMSDIDLLVVSDDLDYSRLFEILAVPEAAIGRKINPTLYTSGDFEKKLAAGNHFLVRVLEQPKIMILGAANDLPAGTSG